jgi:hypothetical protein
MTPRAAPRPSELSTWQDWRVDDCRGVPVGTLAEVYEDLAIAAPVWFLVRLTSYSARFALAPAAEVLSWHGRVCLPYDRARIESAPPVYSAPEEVGPVLEEQLRRHYGLRSASQVDLNVRRTPA